MRPHDNQIDGLVLGIPQDLVDRRCDRTGHDDAIETVSRGRRSSSLRDSSWKRSKSSVSSGGNPSAAQGAAWGLSTTCSRCSVASKVQRELETVPQGGLRTLAEIGRHENLLERNHDNTSVSNPAARRRRRRPSLIRASIATAPEPSQSRDSDPSRGSRDTHAAAARRDDEPAERRLVEDRGAPETPTGAPCRGPVRGARAPRRRRPDTSRKRCRP